MFLTMDLSTYALKSMNKKAPSLVKHNGALAKTHWSVNPGRIQKLVTVNIKKTVDYIFALAIAIHKSKASLVTQRSKMSPYLFG
jgi:hypothetical protein